MKMNNKKRQTNNNLKINQETTKRNTKWWNREPRNVWSQREIKAK